MKKGRMRGFVSPALVSVALAVLVAVFPVASAFTFGESVAYTKAINGGGCEGGILYIPRDGTPRDPWHLDNSPDTVHVPYNVSWDDERFGWNNPTAYHNFTMAALHQGLPAGSAAKRVTTTGAGGLNPSGWVVLWVNVTNVRNGEYVNVTFTATLYGPSGTGCPIDASVTGHYYFVYP